MALRRETKKELLDQAFSSAKTTSLFSAVAGVFFCLILWDQLPSYMLTSWFVMLIVAQIFRVSSSIIHQNRAKEDSYDYSKNLLLYGVLPSSVMWGFFPLISFPYIDDTTKAIISIFIAGAPTAQLLATGSVFRVWVMSTVLLMYPVCILWFFQGTTGIYLGLIGFIYSGYLFALARKYYKLMGERLEHSHIARDASKAKTTFLATASHDLRQPLHAITMSIAAAQTLVSRDTPSKKDLEIASRTLNTAENSVEGLSRLLNALMDVSKIESGGVKPKLANIPVSNLLDHLRGTYQIRAEEKHLELRILPCSLTVYSDPIYLQRIVSNLVSNAVRHVKEGRILVGCKRRGDMLGIYVIDTGPGIPPEKFNEIFQEFSQLENQGRLNDAGQGLGLSIADRLSRALNHTLSVESIPNKGSSFSIEVPISDGAEPAGQLDKKAKRSEVNKRQLVVLLDPNTVTLEETAVQLRQWGYRVLAFTSCEEAQHLQVRPNLIITTQQQPSGLTGFEAVNILRGSWKTDAHALVLISELDAKIMVEATNNNCDVISSPPNPSEFKRSVREAIES